MAFDSGTTDYVTPLLELALSGSYEPSAPPAAPAPGVPSWAYAQGTFELQLHPS